MGTIIREYNPNDKSHCVAAFISNVPLYFTEAEIKDFENFLKRIENLDTKKEIKTYYFVIEHNKRVIGCGGFGDKENKDIISLAWGLIHKDFHKKGLGKKLLLYRLDQIKTLFPDLAVVIDTTQYSYKFFEKYGFYITKITKDFYTMGMHRYDMTFKSYYR